MDPTIESEGMKEDIIKELKDIGACDLCTLRYLGVKESYIFKDKDIIERMLYPKKKGLADSSAVPVPEIVEAMIEEKENGDGPSKAKILKISPCVACLGLLQGCVEEPCLNQIAEDINKAGIEASSYGLMLTLPIAIQIRAYSIWFHLCDKFPQVYNSMGYLKPEGTGMKSVWKWICTGNLKQQVNPNSEWISNGSLVINLFLNYPDDDSECYKLFQMQKKGKRKPVTRGATESSLSWIKPDNFRELFGSPPNLPKCGLSFEKIACTHMAVFLAGRYCKYSRNVSQSPWLNADGSRVRGEGSVQEYIQAQVLPLFNSEQVRFSASGREDSDVRMLGKGRPFVVEIMNPKRSIFTSSRIKELKTKINESTNLISVRDLQLVEKKELSKLKEGEDSKTKSYCALCKTPGKVVTLEMLNILNETPLPLVLHQKTPIRVLHRRSLATRPRSILEMKAEAAKQSPEMFILRVKTEAGTYVKEFVHGDFGRTQPCVADLLGCDTEILALDVDSVELDWPPEIQD